METLLPSLAKRKNIARIPRVGGSREPHFISNHSGNLIMAVKVELDKCTGCGECVSSCPLDAIVIKDGKAVVDDSCAECGACVDACPNKSLVL